MLWVVQNWVRASRKFSPSSKATPKVRPGVRSTPRMADLLRDGAVGRVLEPGPNGGRVVVAAGDGERVDDLGSGGACGQGGVQEDSRLVRVEEAGPDESSAEKVAFGSGESV